MASLPPDRLPRGWLFRRQQPQLHRQGSERFRDPQRPRLLHQRHPPQLDQPRDQVGREGLEEDPRRGLHHQHGPERQRATIHPAPAQAGHREAVQSDQPCARSQPTTATGFGHVDAFMSTSTPAFRRQLQRRPEARQLLGRSLSWRWRTPPPTAARAGIPEPPLLSRGPGALSNRRQKLLGDVLRHGLRQRGCSPRHAASFP